MTCWPSGIFNSQVWDSIKVQPYSSIVGWAIFIVINLIVGYLSEQFKSDYFLNHYLFFLFNILILITILKKIVSIRNNRYKKHSIFMFQSLLDINDYVRKHSLLLNTNIGYIVITVHLLLRARYVLEKAYKGYSSGIHLADMH